MFFIMGIQPGKKSLNLNQMIVCRNCGKYGRLEVYVVYTVLSLFFIPVLKWGKQYMIQTSCCGYTAPIDRELGKKIERGEVTSLPEDIIPENFRSVRNRRCGGCGFETEEDYQFCPKCGRRME